MTAKDDAKGEKERKKYLFTTEAQSTQRMHQREAMPRVAMWPAPTTWHFISL